MKVRNVLSALIGLWFIIAPWIVGFSDDSGALWTSVIVGAVQLIVSLCAYGKADGWSSWQNWVAVLAGVWFIVLPFVFSLSNGEMWASIILGAVTVIAGLWNMGAKSA